MCSSCFPRSILPADASLSSTGSSEASSPASLVLSKRYDALLPSRRASFPSLGGTSDALVGFAPWWTSAPPRPGVGHPVSPPGIRRGANRVLPSSRGTPLVRLHMFQTDAGRTACTRPFSAAAWPLVIERQRLPQKVFRRSIAWLSDSLSTLRSAGYPAPRKTRFRPLVRRYRTGFPPAGFLRKVSKLSPYISSSLPKLCLAQSCRPVSRTQLTLTTHATPALPQFGLV